MLCADRIMIGTANWGKEYRGHKVPEDEIKRILDYCQCSGIHRLDCARAYECDDLIDKLANSSFKIQYKVDDFDPVPDFVDVVISHGTEPHGSGFSFYEPMDVDSPFDVCQIPYSIVDRRWESYLHAKQLWQARSIFCGGKVFTSCHSNFAQVRLLASRRKMGIGELCVLFCLLNPNIDKIVVGANGVHELKENFRILHRLDGLQIDDLGIIDLRRNPSGKENS